MTGREAEFCKLLIDLACQLGHERISIIFPSQAGDLILDKGSIKFSEHRGFIRPLANDPDGVVSSIELSFRVEP